MLTFSLQVLFSDIGSCDYESDSDLDNDKACYFCFSVVDWRIIMVFALPDCLPGDLDLCPRRMRCDWTGIWRIAQHSEIDKCIR
jgi:hypothetical protein